MNRRKKKMKTSTIVLIVICFVGLSLLLYPTVADFYNTHVALKAVNNYNETISEIDEEDLQEIWDEAVEFNKRLAGQGGFALHGDMEKEYYSLLNAVDDGMMGYIEIPKINLTLPVYHGTGDEVLAAGIGHLEWSSLPTGGASTHCCLSGHSGLVNARLFTDLELMEVGDTFILNILDKVLTYEVDQIRTVLPDEVNDLHILNGKDLCTLITCTPYGINTHRLLVRGHRIENAAGEAHVVSEAVIIDELIVASVLAFLILFVMFLAVMFKKPDTGKKRNRKYL